MLLKFQSVDEDFLEAFNFIIRSGRLVARPIFKGTFDRDDGNCCLGIGDAWGESFLETGAIWSDFQIKWVQELSRTIDYLQTREDVDSSSFGFYGLSWGSGTAPIVLAVEDRIGPAVLNVGGLEDMAYHLPEADPFTFVGRVRNPVLMLNGKYDVTFAYETSQRPMFEMLGTAPADKKHFVTSTGHIVPRVCLFGRRWSGLIAISVNGIIRLTIRSASGGWQMRAVGV